MKKNIAIFMVLVCMMAMLSGCGQKEKTEIVVFAAASMTETLNEIKTVYEKANPGVTVT